MKEPQSGPMRVHVRLVPISLDHAPAVQALAADPRIAATTNVPHPYPPDGATTWIRFTMAQREMGSEMNFGIFDDTTLVGVCGVLSMGGVAAPVGAAQGAPALRHGSGSPRASRGASDRRGASGEMGYWIGVPYWGRGLATAGARELLRIAFEDEGLDHLRSSCLVRNMASLRVLEKIGFRLVGYGSHPGTKWTEEDRFALFELTRDEYTHMHRVGRAFTARPREP